MHRFAKPNWNFWIKPDTRVRLWEGVCLIIDMEPPRPFGREIAHLFELKDFPKEFHKAWNILNRDENFSKLEEVGTAGRMLHSINLDGFANWAMYKGFDIPAELRKISEQFSSSNDRSAPKKVLTEPTQREQSAGALASQKTVAATDKKLPLRLEVRKAAMLAWLTTNGYDPLSLPDWKGNPEGAKSKLKKAMLEQDAKLFTESSFRKAWDDLGSKREVRYKK